MLQNAWATDQIPRPDVTNLTRPQLEWIDLQARQNEACHAQLGKCSAPPPNIQTWQEITIYITAGIAFGMIFEHQLQK